MTISTQIGGLVYLITLLLVRNNSPRYRLKRFTTFSLLYLITTILFVPIIAPIFGREKIKKFEYVEARTFMTDLMNRNYVRPELNTSLQKIATGLDKKYPGIKLVYLDANFPFINKFPLLPHLSHSDGKKIDISLIYTDENGKLTNKKPSISGYGVYEGPKPSEYNQIEKCLDKGKWQYDFPRYLTFGIINSELTFSEKATKDLIQEILKQPSTGKLFIEPHLKTRLNMKNQRIRFHGCQAVRHDDHIHFQLK
ncbi:hypothetical protein [Maribacter algarum]|uniref:hypothetical protein n=1 Tax=Maribacter algarum (ex Zhang et al. 2020) TaxID=2578118 RepID=UPI001EE5EBDC|nr:hypothetical protein [Maribacter algarum]